MTSNPKRKPAYIIPSSATYGTDDLDLVASDQPGIRVLAAGYHGTVAFHGYTLIAETQGVEQGKDVAIVG